MMLNNNPYSEVKGFNYWPSYAMVLNDVMDRFDLEIVKRELKGAQNLGASCVPGVGQQCELAEKRPQVSL